MFVHAPQLMDLIGVAWVETDGDGRVRRANDRAETFIGRTRGEFLGAPWTDVFVDEAHRAGAGRAFAAAEPSGSTTCVGEIPGDDGVRIVDWRLSRIEGDDGPHVVCLGMDVSDREADRRRLQETVKALSDLRGALDVSAIVAVTDARGVITHVNETFCEISGYDADELIGQTHRLINSGHHERGFFKQMWGEIGRGRVWRGDICNRAKDGQIYWVATTIVPVMNDRGRPERYLAIRFDITDRKRAERALTDAHDRLVEVNRRLVEDQASLVQAEKLSSIGLLASGVAHEINNPLAGAMACLKMLREDQVPAERKGEYFEVVADALARIKETVNGLLDYARERPLSRAPVATHRLVNACLLLLAPILRKRRVASEVRIDEGTQVEADRSQLMQAVMNVLLNAVHASPPGGRLVVEIASASAAPRAGLTGIRVVDEGPGISPEDLSRVCDPFFTTKAEGEGTGLGLSITVGIMRAHGGELTIDSELGSGTTVTLWLPSADTSRGDGTGDETQ